jgi:hypothetical protein
MDKPDLPHIIHHTVTQPRVIKLMEAELFTLDNPGICLVCGAGHNECEPDATNYECHECGQHFVFGAGEIMLMGYYRKPVTAPRHAVTGFTQEQLDYLTGPGGIRIEG